MIWRAFIYFCLGAASLAVVGNLPAETWQWDAVGIGGGGRYLSPGISPHNPDLLFSGSDMGGAYRSETGGAAWDMPPETMLRRLHFELKQPHHLWTFHPVDPNLIFVGSIQGFSRSTDAGKTWEPIDGVWNETAADGSLVRRGPRVTVFDRSAPDTGVALFNSSNKDGSVGIFLTQDRGQSWVATTGLPAGSGGVINVLFVPDHGASVLFAATTGGVYRSTDLGGTWERVVNGLPLAGGLELMDFAGGANAGGSLLYATATTADDKDGARRWLYISKDGAKTWGPAVRTGLFANPARPASFGLLAASPFYPEIVYATITGGDEKAPTHPGQRALYRSNDSGTNWTPVWYQNVKSERYNIANDSWLKGQWGWTYPPSGIAVDDADQNIVFATTISSALITHDGGKTWKQVHAPEGAKDHQPAGGMMVTSAWSYAINPKHPERRFIALTDYSGWRSVDSGKTWEYRPDGNPWHNNTYAIALDSDRVDRVWAACSVTHDIPTWRYQADLGSSKYVGGVVNSDDGGRNWTPVAKDSGLPRKAVTDIWLDPASPKNARHLWAAVPGSGAYASEDDGKTWRARNTGLAFDNLNVLRIRGDARGRLFALTTVKVKGDDHVPGALYLSTDQGHSWKKIFSESEAPFLTHVEIAPDKEGAIYVCALHTRDSFETASGGGVWKSADNGATWSHIFKKPAYAIGVDPRNPRRLFVSCWFDRGDGLHTSTDGGVTWTRVANYPFWRPLTITFDPEDARTIYVTNFGGGVFRGVLQ